MRLRARIALTCLTCLVPVATYGQAPSPPVADARAILRELVGIDTAEPQGNTTVAAERLAARLRAAGFSEEDVKVIGPDARHGNLVARLRGRGTARPVLFLAHLDVVAAAREDWSVDPFTLTEQGGYYYGRGTTDDKVFCAIWTAVFIELKRQNVVPAGDLILALTAGEEGGRGNTFNGVRWLLEQHRLLIDAAYCINGDAGGGTYKDSKHQSFGIQTEEKTYVDFALEVVNAGGHSSRPVKDNAIYRLARALTRIDDGLVLPVTFSETTRTYLTKMAALESPALGADLRAVLASPPDPAALARINNDPGYNALLRTTCVATQVAGGHAPNALPQRASANINCRLLPGDGADDIRLAIEKVINDPQVTIRTAVAAGRSPAPQSIDPVVFGLLETAAHRVWPAVPVMPMMETGGTDGKELRLAGIPAYGVNHFEADEDHRAHGRDERIRIDHFDDAARFGLETAKLAAGVR
jgi:acetylornithine deacetylase/succinyl-diaminopimelate desuccinylase-like protein